VVTRRVLLLATKDTIAQSRRPGHEAVASGAELLRAIPAPAARVSVEDVVTEPSWDVTPATMVALARRARAAIAEDGFDGVVVAYGADALEDVAFLADCLAGPGGPIVFTAATRPLDDPFSDGPRNLASAVTAASDPALTGAGAVVCLNDEVHAARWVTQVDADCFSSGSHPLLGRVTGTAVETLAAPPPRPPKPRGEPETNVALIKTYPGIEADLLHAAVDSGARGVVLEGTGRFNVPATLLAAISDLTEWDIPVVVASRSRTRPVDLTDLPAGTAMAAALGAIGARDLPAGKAHAALMVALGAIGGVRVARDWFRHLDRT
jgi:L-asparaginase